MRPSARARNLPRLGLVVMLVAALTTGFYLGRPRSPEFEFLREASLVGVHHNDSKLASKSQARTTTYFYTLRGAWTSIFDRAKSQLPDAMESKLGLHGEEARQLVVPRHEDGRISILFPPERIIYVVPGRLSMNEHGRPTVVQGSHDGWTTVEVLDFRRPSALDSLTEWIKNAARI